MKYYSDKTKKYYEEDQLDALKADEEAFDKENQRLLANSGKQIT